MASTSHPATAAQVKRVENKRSSATGLLHCLVVSGEADRREALSWAALQGGWKTVPCVDVPMAEACFRRMFLQLAVVDLQRSNHVPREHLEKLIETLAASGNMLLVVCGDEGNLDQEIWARQIGVWMYVPGINHGSDLKTLLGEAHCLAQRMGLPTGAIPKTEKQKNGFDLVDETRSSSRKPFRRRKARRGERS